MVRISGGNSITPVNSSNVIRGVGLKSIGSTTNSELLNLTDNNTNTVLSVIGNTTTGSVDLVAKKHNPITISATGIANNLTVDSNQVLNLPLATISGNGAMSSLDKTKLNNIGTVYSYSFANYTYSVAPNSWYTAADISLPIGSYIIYGQLYTNANNTIMQIAIQDSSSFTDTNAWSQSGNCATLAITVPFSLSQTTRIYLHGNNSTSSIYYGFSYSKFYAIKIA